MPSPNEPRNDPPWKGRLAPHRSTVYVRVDHEVGVCFPVEIPEDQINEDGSLKEGKYRDAAVNLAVGFLRSSVEIDASGEDLGIRFKTSGKDSSFAKVTCDCMDTDVQEVRIES